ncbi:hypothetical protein [Desulfobacca acetoxidans]|uniref:Addiction module protein n=1 Tax=Desulfobacca acetoxidans (strain ATCC 700848 / DSM 11109 / ASRB2) TaxID=880072 RepID=F2NCW9_DESAR|nr:hypothetical protein [Desulfobacca acetoxidans]AEB09543.1 hypothetical protein Desac_1699 [Desulfobacca acetoxidans DSM 11109]
MAPGSREVLIGKFEAVLRGPDGELLADILDRFFVRLPEQMDTEPLSAKEAEALESGRRALATGDSSYFTPWEEVKKELGL